MEESSRCLQAELIIISLCSEMFRAKLIISWYWKASVHQDEEEFLASSLHRD